eukprot:CAMPEP_0206436710 /NCGR_PEP_ID=MMETSP0324_2-20121206/10637_1 /ASSEMBLY_ACC=CAM_ASM_000836 /TAXON_ID=2866 /ORGANISM="Crypthecodinium cohnii, Strain Seligo" /LENGTH=181 /DNA_ID=CAMNT_0053903911 /DNA_START=963 /DNA_END=1508 /DNA_ORIENTATION=-
MSVDHHSWTPPVSSLPQSCQIGASDRGGHQDVGSNSVYAVSNGGDVVQQQRTTLLWCWNVVAPMHLEPRLHHKVRLGRIDLHVEARSNNESSLFGAEDGLVQATTVDPRDGSEIRDEVCEVEKLCIAADSLVDVVNSIRDLLVVAVGPDVGVAEHEVVYRKIAHDDQQQLVPGDAIIPVDI